MITKDQFANDIINKFCESEGIKREELTEGHVFRSSAVGVAMDHLNLITDESLKNYIDNRAGSFITIFEGKDISMLSVREMLKLLPDTI